MPLENNRTITHTALGLPSTGPPLWSLNYCQVFQSFLAEQLEASLFSFFSPLAVRVISFKGTIQEDFLE
jgi:hypothetical protein